MPAFPLRFTRAFLISAIICSTALAQETASGETKSDYTDMLLEPMAAWLQADLFEIKVAKKLDFAWSFNFYRESGERGVKIGPEGGLSGEAVSLLAGRLPFSRAEVVDRETDPSTKAYQILWNSAYAQLLARDVLYGLELSWLNSQRVLRTSKGIFHRKLAKEKGVFFREVLQVFSPPVVSGLAHLNTRSFSTAGEQVWVHSPVLGRARRVLPANRSDAILKSDLALDDFFVFSAKIQSHRARVVAEKVLLLPFPGKEAFFLRSQAVDLSIYRQVKEDDLTEPRVESMQVSIPSVTAGGKATGFPETWNYQSRVFPQKPAWVPTGVSFIPRQVWILELFPKDPFYSDGKQILVFDRESFLPFYKLVYSRKGKLKRSLLAAWSLARRPDKKKIQLPFLSFLLSIDAQAESAVSWTSLYVNTFLGKSSKAAHAYRDLLEIENHGQMWLER